MSDREDFIRILEETRRPGMDKVLAGLDELGFYDAPASTRFHGCTPGGLLVHSLNVYREAVVIGGIQAKLKPGVEASLPRDSVAIAALLHDVCKAEVYRQAEKFRKDKNGKWEKYASWDVDYSAFPVGHGEKSVIRLLRWGLEMTDDEIMAIRWHMSGFDLAFQSAEAKGNFGAASDKCPLLAVLKAADGLASHVLE